MKRPNTAIEQAYMYMYMCMYIDILRIAIHSDATSTKCQFCVANLTKMY